MERLFNMKAKLCYVHGEVVEDYYGNQVMVHEHPKGLHFTINDEKLVYKINRFDIEGKNCYTVVVPVNKEDRYFDWEVIIIDEYNFVVFDKIVNPWHYCILLKFITDTEKNNVFYGYRYTRFSAVKYFKVYSDYKIQEQYNDCFNLISSIKVPDKEVPYFFCKDSRTIFTKDMLPGCKDNCQLILQMYGIPDKEIVLKDLEDPNSIIFSHTIWSYLTIKYSKETPFIYYKDKFLIPYVTI